MSSSNFIGFTISLALHATILYLFLHTPTLVSEQNDAYAMPLVVFQGGGFSASSSQNLVKQSEKSPETPTKDELKKETNLEEITKVQEKDKSLQNAKELSQETDTSLKEHEILEKAPKEELEKPVQQDDEKELLTQNLLSNTEITKQNKKDISKQKLKPIKKSIKNPTQTVTKTNKKVIELVANGEKEAKDSQNSRVQTNSNLPNNQNLQPEILSSKTSQSNPIFVQIQEAISKNLIYPQIALNNGYEGITTIKFKIYPNESISDIKIKSSSKFNILDKSAIASLKKAQKSFPKIDKEYQISVDINFKISK